MNALDDFKQEMVEYYKTSKTALSNYDYENPHPFKSICLKCNKYRSLAQPVSCCFQFCDYVFYLFLYFLIFWARRDWLTML